MKHTNGKGIYKMGVARLTLVLLTSQTERKSPTNTQTGVVFQVNATNMVLHWIFIILITVLNLVFFTVNVNDRQLIEIAVDPKIVYKTDTIIQERMVLPEDQWLYCEALKKE